MIGMTSSRTARRFITFYSYKGGVGRTMALANIAWRLADKHALRVLVVDWDLEAPGLHTFFGFEQAELARARGVLDFFIDWREAMESDAPAPPDVRGSLLPVTRRPYAPRNGSLSLLTAGRMDEAFESRLASFDWRSFYKEHRGAAAVETLREQLSESADMVLIDSRTGLTDAGGICTIQIPDGVVLMTVANEQSLRGIKQIARGIVDAPEEARAGRGAPTLWLSVSRVSIVEETILTERWFADHAQWFEDGAKEGLWTKEHHRAGLASHTIPHRARWSFGEQLLHDTSGVDSADPLAEAFERMTVTLLEWGYGERATDLMKPPAEKVDIDALRVRALEAERRGDIPGLSAALLNLGSALDREGRFEEASGVLERNAGIALARGNRIVYAYTLLELGKIRLRQERYDDSVTSFEQALSMARDIGSRELELSLLTYLGQVRSAQKHFDEAVALGEQAIAIARDLHYLPFEVINLRRLGQVREAQARIGEALAFYEEALARSRDNEARPLEEDILEDLARVSRAQAPRGESGEAEPTDTHPAAPDVQKPPHG